MAVFGAVFGLHLIFLNNFNTLMLEKKKLKHAALSIKKTGLIIKALRTGGVDFNVGIHGRSKEETRGQWHVGLISARFNCTNVLPINVHG
jgi:hypothetical protein